MNVRSKTLWLTRTAVLTAVLIALQWCTKPFGQLFTGSCVNGVLAVAALCSGLSSGLCIAAVSPVIAFFLSIGPDFFPLIPVIALGNCLYVLVIWLLAGKIGSKLWQMAAGVVSGAVCKAAALYLLVVQGICRFAAQAGVSLYRHVLRAPAHHRPDRRCRGGTGGAERQSRTETIIGGTRK